MGTEKTRTVSVRFPIELLAWIDRYSRITAVTGDKRVTRNMTVISFLEMAKGLIELREKNEFESGSHVAEIEKIIAVAKAQQQDEGE